MVPTCHTWTDDVQLPRHAHRDGLQTLVQHQEAEAHCRRADIHSRTGFHRIADARLHGGFSRAVAVVQPPTRRPLRDDLRRAGLAHQIENTERLETVVTQRRQRGRCNGGMSDLLAPENIGQFGATVHSRRNDHDLRRGAECHRQLEDGSVETRDAN